MKACHPLRHAFKRAGRKPRLLLRLAGSFLLRFAERQLKALLFQLPPRLTRLDEPHLTPRPLTIPQAASFQKSVASDRALLLDSNERSCSARIGPFHHRYIDHFCTPTPYAAGAFDNVSMFLS